MYVKVKDNQNLLRDTTTGAILNTDRSVLKKHELREREMFREKKREDEINKLKSDISEIKALLHKLIENG